MDKLPKLVENHLGMRHVWYYECLPNHPVCKAFVLFGSHYGPLDEAFAREEAKYWAKEAGITAYITGWVKLEYKVF